MSTTSTRTVTIGFQVGVDPGVNAPDMPYDAASNANSPGSTDLVNLSSGANTITKPSGGSTVTGMTIIPPVGNTTLITLKGVTGDTGVPLHLTDPSSFGVDSTLSSVCLTAAGAITGVRIIWT